MVTQGLLMLIYIAGFIITAILLGSLFKYYKENDPINTKEEALYMLMIFLCPFSWISALVITITHWKTLKKFFVEK